MRGVVAGLEVLPGTRVGGIFQQKAAVCAHPAAFSGPAGEARELYDVNMSIKSQAIRRVNLICNLPSRLCRGGFAMCRLDCYIVATVAVTVSRQRSGSQSGSSLSRGGAAR